MIITSIYNLRSGYFVYSFKLIFRRSLQLQILGRVGQLALSGQSLCYRLKRTMAIGMGFYTERCPTMLC